MPTIILRLSDEQKKQIRSKAGAADKSMNKYILDCINKPLIFACKDHAERINEEAIIKPKQNKNSTLRAKVIYPKKNPTPEKFVEVLGYPKSKSLNKKK